MYIPNSHSILTLQSLYLWIFPSNPDISAPNSPDLQAGAGQLCQRGQFLWRFEQKKVIAGGWCL